MFQLYKLLFLYYSPHSLCTKRYYSTVVGLDWSYSVLLPLFCRKCKLKVKKTTSWRWVESRKVAYPQKNFSHSCQKSGINFVGLSCLGEAWYKKWWEGGREIVLRNCAGIENRFTRGTTAMTTTLSSSSSRWGHSMPPPPSIAPRLFHVYRWLRTADAQKVLDKFGIQGGTLPRGLALV